MKRCRGYRLSDLCVRAHTRICVHIGIRANNIAQKSLYLIYSGTPLYRHLWKAAIYDIVGTLFGPECNSYVCVHSKPLKCGTLVFRKADKFFSPTSTRTVQNSLDNADACMPLMQDWPVPLIDSPTGHYNNTGTHSTSLWLAFLTSVRELWKAAS